MQLKGFKRTGTHNYVDCHTVENVESASSYIFDFLTNLNYTMLIRFKTTTKNNADEGYLGHC